MLAAAALIVVSGSIVSVTPAQAATAQCPIASKAEAKRSYKAMGDTPPRGADAIKGVRVGYLPTGFSGGQVVVNKHHGVAEYGYQWTDKRSDTDPKASSLWVRVVCWPKASKLSQLKNAPFDLGTFSGDTKRATLGGRKVLTMHGDGALGTGLLVGWVERKGTVVTVMASQPLVGDLDKIVAGIRL